MDRCNGSIGQNNSPYLLKIIFRSITALLVLLALTGCPNTGGNNGSGSNTTPVADSDSYNGVAEGGSLNIGATAGVLNGDTDANGDTLIAILDSSPSNSTSFNLNSDGSFTYQHDGSENFSDSFTYHAQDSKGADSSIVTVSISIVPVNDPPVAVDDTYTVPAPAGTININAASGLLANDTDPEGPPPTNASWISDPNYGSFILNTDGSFDYTHTGGSDDCGNGRRCDSFTYKANDGLLTSTTTATVTIFINQPPVAANGCVSTPGNYDNAGGAAFVGVMPATDPEGGVLTYSINPSNVSLKGSAIPTDATSGNFSYTPTTAGLLGMDKFNYEVTDDQGLTATGSVWVFIGDPVNGKSPALRIMPVGDSITKGLGGDDGGFFEDTAGYRLKLYNDLVILTNGQYNIDFVGSQSSGTGPGLTDIDHEGHPGWCDGDVPCSGGFGNVADYVESWLTTEPADIVLLHIGTNDFETNATDVGTILNKIDAWEGTAGNSPLTVFLARIIKDVPLFGSNFAVTTYNDNVSGLVSLRLTDRVFMVDMEDGALLDYGTGSPGLDMADNLHPNQRGYNKMADKWLNDMSLATVGDKFQGLPQCP